jgi:hypothetical protein
MAHGANVAVMSVHIHFVFERVTVSAQLQKLQWFHFLCHVQIGNSITPRPRPRPRRPRPESSLRPAPAISSTAVVSGPAEMGSTSSMLIQYDIEEVQDHCNHACESLTLTPNSLPLI